MEYTEDTYLKSIPNLSRNIFFKNKVEFESFIEKIDQKMIREGIPIKGRQIRGISEAAIKLKTQIPWVPKSFAKKEDYSILSLSAHISIWFEKKYENLLDLGFANKSIVKLKGDYYKLNVLHTFGEPKFIFDVNKELLENGSINIAKSVQGLTEYVIKNITTEEIKLLAQRLFDVICLTQKLEQLIEFDMMKEAKSDFIQSVESFFRDENVPGLSKWHSLQFSEKIFKVFISHKEANFSFTHKLNDLLNEAKKCGLNSFNKFDVELIQCKPEVRYDSKLVSNEEAFIAHIEAIKLAIYVLNEIKT